MSAMGTVDIATEVKEMKKVDIARTGGISASRVGVGDKARVDSGEGGSVCVCARAQEEGSLLRTLTTTCTGTHTCTTHHLATNACSGRS